MSQDEPTDSLRVLFGLAPERSEPDAPPVDEGLLREFYFSERMTKERFRQASDLLGRFEEWRRAYRKIVDELSAPNP